MAIRPLDKITERELADSVDNKLNYLANKKLSENIIVGGQHGSFIDGETLIKGTRVHDVLQGMLNPDYMQNYKLPVLKLTGVDEKIEIGSVISFSLVPVFNQNDAGPLNRFVLERSVAGGKYVTLYDSDTIKIHNESNISVTELKDILSFRATAWFDEGKVKYKNGEEIPGHIEAGSITEELRIVGVRKCFYGAESGIRYLVESSDDVRNLPNAININSVVSINIPTGTSRITLAYPSYVGDIKRIESKKLGYDVKEVFEKNNIRVKGANGYMDLDYQVYSYIPDIEYPSDDEYIFYID